MHEPLPLIAGTYRQGPTTFVLAETPDGVGDWHLAHDPHGSFTGMAFGNASVLISDFAERHRYLSTSPDSPFVRTVTVQRRDATTITVLRGLRFRTIDLQGATTSVIEQRDEWFSLLADQFGLTLSAAGTAASDALWRHANTRHEAYLAALGIGQRSMPNAPTVAAVVPSRS